MTQLFNVVLLTVRDPPELASIEAEARIPVALAPLLVHAVLVPLMLTTWLQFNVSNVIICDKIMKNLQGIDEAIGLFKNGRTAMSGTLSWRKNIACSTLCDELLAPPAKYYNSVAPYPFVNLLARAAPAWYLGWLLWS